jgi:hypothetical protein
MSNPSRRTRANFTFGGEVQINQRFSLGVDGGTFPFNGSGEESRDITWNAYRVSIGTSYHSAHHLDRKLDPFLAAGITWRLEDYEKITGPHRVWHKFDDMIYFGGGINYWVSPQYGLKLELRDHVWLTNGTTLHYMDMRVGICWRFLLN